MTARSPKSRPRVLSGMRPTGKLHLGNYVGALKNWVTLQDSHECFFFVADWHALTTDYDDTSRLAGNSVEIMLDYLAAGLDPEKSTLFVQSHVLEHAELHILFSMITPLGWLERVPSYKDQQIQMPNKDLHMYGFLGYPLLQAADILVYRANFVPVGEDQVSHIELTREVARRFNGLYGVKGEPVFPEPDALLTPSPKLLGTDKRKMSKSYGNTIFLSDDAVKVEEKIKNSVTDRPKLTDKGNPSECPVGNLHQIFSDPERLAYITRGCTTAGITCVECKSLAVASVNAHLEPIRRRRHALTEHPERLQEVMQEGADKARRVAEETMKIVREAVGLLAPTSAIWKTSEPRLTGLDELDEQDRVKRIRDYWLKKIGSSHSLRDVGHNTFVNRKNKRIALASPAKYGHDCWHFKVEDRHYDLLVLNCPVPSDPASKWNDFVIPMNSITSWKSFKREGKNVVFDVRQTSEGTFLESDASERQDIAGFHGLYDLLS